MTVIEVVKAYHLEDYSKSYKNLYDECVDLSFSLDELGKMVVKDIYINLLKQSAEITLLTIEK